MRLTNYGGMKIIADKGRYHIYSPQGEDFGSVGSLEAARNWIDKLWGSPVLVYDPTHKERQRMKFYRWMHGTGRMTSNPKKWRPPTKTCVVCKREFVPELKSAEDSYLDAIFHSYYCPKCEKELSGKTYRKAPWHKADNPNFGPAGIHRGFRIMRIPAWSTPGGMAYNVHDYNGEFVAGQFLRRSDAKAYIDSVWSKFGKQQKSSSNPRQSRKWSHARRNADLIELVRLGIIP